ncbi:LysR substrate-binding domain-containing protein [Ramlibacter sp.]|uniref:LysR substrate-binding domain-containing protein n=1 Tax=Ramlibacter sp. TaxID=1917967 RepID=UPI002BF38B97|nr:LysR substrate-binding domain-containing protein [Ramlibacter sp.]HWI83872.1 LysR substrate-binding domain-containing protein [Ramlibacter sp.]
MRIRSPSIAELHALAAAARHGNFSRAAAELCVTQGAISRSIARLEEHLGQPVFRRQGRHSVLTQAGQAYLDAVGPALQAIEAATVQAQSRQAPADLRVSVTPTLFSHWLIPRLPDFRRRHPGIGLSFAPYRRDDGMDAADVHAWLRGGSAPWPRHIRAHYVVGRELVPICRPEDAAGLATPQDLLARPLLFHTNYPDNWAHWFRSVGCEPRGLQPAADFELVSLLVQAVIAGLGVAVVQRCLVEDELAAGRIAAPIATPVLNTRGYHLCHAARLERMPALVAFREWLLGPAAQAPVRLPPAA